MQINVLDYLNDEGKFTSELQSRPALFFTKEELDLISDKTVVQAGLGGVGSLVVDLFARMGIKRFRLIDMDKYDISNIGRQIHATLKTVGLNKAEVAAQKIKEINSFAKTEYVYCEELNNKNARVLLDGADIVIGEVGYAGLPLLHHYAKKYKLPLVSGNCSNVTGGRVSLFDYRMNNQRSMFEPTGIRWIDRRLYKNNMRISKFFRFEDIERVDDNKFLEISKTCNVLSPTLNFVSNLISCLVVAESIKLLTRRGKTVLFPREIYFDIFNLKMRTGSFYAYKIINYLKKLIA